jgi:hypothetical protein
MSQEATNEYEAVRALAEIPAAQMRRQRRTQMQVLLEVLRIAAQYETWVSLAELADKTKFPPASISAQLRHLRKEKFGGWKVERRRREWSRDELVWEYKLGV